MINKKYLAKKSRIIFDDYIQFIVTALGLVSALSWNSAFQKYFEQSKYLKKKRTLDICLRMYPTNFYFNYNS